MNTEQRKANSSARVARWRARNPEKARLQTKEAVKRFNENHKIELAALRAEIKRLRKALRDCKRQAKA